MPIPTAPLTFSPILKRIIWGGRQLGERLGKSIGEGTDYAESWELVDRADDQSVVDGGEFRGMSIHDLVQKFPREMLGSHAETSTGDGEAPAFPLLIKYLDCNRVLSVQVHPDDNYARKMPTPDLGKTEAWYIVEAKPGSVIYAGLRDGVDRETLASAIQAGKTADMLHSFEPVAGQCVFIPAGTVHALGDGLLVAEVQQSSDTTFRLFDWDRVDAKGKPRDLHVAEALTVTDYHRGPIRPQSPGPEENGWRSLVKCDKFVLRQSASSLVPGGTLVTGKADSPTVLMVTGGSIRLDNDTEIGTGQTVFLPAAVGETTLTVMDSATQILEIRLP